MVAVTKLAPHTKKSTIMKDYVLKCMPCRANAVLPVDLAEILPRCGWTSNDESFDDSVVPEVALPARPVTCVHGGA